MRQKNLQKLYNPWPSLLPVPSGGTKRKKGRIQTNNAILGVIKDIQNDLRIDDDTRRHISTYDVDNLHSTRHDSKNGLVLEVLWKKFAKSCFFMEVFPYHL